MVIQSSRVNITNAEPTWANYVTEWSSEPVLHSSPAGGELFTYTYPSRTLYRFVPEPYNASEDTFYTDTGMTDPVATRARDI